MNRRAFIAALACAAVWPLAVRAQQGERMRRVGVLMNGNENDPLYRGYIAAFLQALGQLGWRDGQNLRIDLRWPAGDAKHVDAYAAELVGMIPDLILCSSSANLRALLRATRTTKIVFVLVSDPVSQGFVSNLAHPGGNITGFSAFEPSMASKWLDLLMQVVAQPDACCCRLQPRYISPVPTLRASDQGIIVVFWGRSHCNACPRRSATLSL